MAVLISPSNNSGWGLGCRGMYGGARSMSETRPLLVRRHYRASWGSRKGRAPSARMTITDDPVADVVNAIGPGRRRRRRSRLRSARVAIRSASRSVRAARALLRRARRRLALRGRMRITSDPVADVVRAVQATVTQTAPAAPAAPAVVVSAPRRSARIAARSVAGSGNIVWVRRR